MILDKNTLNGLLPLYEVQEVTLEEALILLKSERKRSVESLIARAGERLHRPAETRLCQQGFAGSI